MSYQNNQNDYINVGTSVDEKKIEIPLSTLKKHFVALGSSGSGKTVLCKTIIEEAALKKIPSIIIDPQGDLTSLSLIDENTSKEIRQSIEKNVNVTIFTPTSSKGIPLCINPLKLPDVELEHEDLVSILNQISNSICKLIGYDLDKDDGKSAQAAIFLLLEYCYKQKIELNNFDDLIDKIRNIPDKIKNEVSQFIDSKQDTDKLIKKIKFLTVGEKELLFEFGMPINIPALLGIDKKNNENDKTQVSVIYLNSLESQEDKEFFVSMLATKLYEWMLTNPKKDVQAIFYIDEISSFLPAGAIKPVSKPILTLLYKQARKYGVSCLMSTQNPGDIDYKAFSQVGTWAIGRLTTDQDRDKIKDALKSLAKGGEFQEVINNLPSLKPGHFIFFSPDSRKDIIELKVRRLYTKHSTLTEKDIKEITTSEKIKPFEKYFIKKEKKQVLYDKIETKVPIRFDSKPRLYLKQNISEKKARELVLKKIRQKLPIFTSRKTLSEINLIFEPVIRAKIKKINKFFIGKSTNTYEIFLDIHSYNIIDIIKGKRYFGISEMMDLSHDDISVLKEIISSFDITLSKLMTKLEFDKKRIEKSISNLKKLKLITSEIYNNNLIFTVLSDISMPSSISSINQKELEYEEKIKKRHDDIKLNKIDLEKISVFFNFWYKNCEIIECSVIFCPLFEVEVIDEKGRTQKAYLNAYNGKMSFIN
jgi:hypothetical protein